MKSKQTSDSAQTGPGVGSARHSPRPYKAGVSLGYGKSGEDAKPGNRNSK
jgi:hypothetical protein